MTTTVGAIAAINNFPACNVFPGNLELNIVNPAGFGAFAKMDNPPPEIAPETKAHFMGSVSEDTCEPKYVKAALSVIPVRPVVTKYNVI